MAVYSGLISDMAAAQQSGGLGVELWVVDANGQIWTIYQTTPGGAWSSWQSPFEGQVVPAWKVTAADQNTGCLMFFMLDWTGYVWAISQLSPGGQWGEWSDSGLANQPVPFVQISAGQQGGNRGVSLKAIDTDGEIWVLYQTTPGGAWSNWEGPGFKNQPEPMSNLTQAGQNNGDLELFTLNAQGSVWAIPQLSPGGDWGAWTGPGLANQPVPFVQFSAAQQSGNRGVSLKTIAGDGQMWVLYQTSPGGAWSKWEGPGFKKQPVPMRLLTQAGQNNGDLEVFTVDTSGNMWTIKQLSPGGDWGPWSLMPMPPADETSGWYEIGSGYSSIVGAGGMLYAVDGQNNPWLFSGLPGQWTQVGGPGYQFVGTYDGFYGISPQKDAVNSYDITTNTWEQIGGAMAELVPAWTALHGVDAQGYVWMYSGTPGTWNNMGGPFKDVSANDDYCFAIAADGQSVLMTATGTSAWITIGGPMESLIASGDNIYGVDGSGNLFWYTGTPMQWNQIGSDFSQVAAWGVQLYALTADQSMVLCYQPDLELWQPIAGPTGTICAGVAWIAGLQGGTVSLRQLDSSDFSDDTTEAALARQARLPDDMVAGTTSTSTTNWMVEISVAGESNDDYYDSSFIGRVGFGINGSRTQTLMESSYRPGRAYGFALNVSESQISSIRIGVKNHGQANTLHVASIACWNQQNGNYYTFQVNAALPNINDEVQYLQLRPTTSKVIPPPSSGVIVYIWKATSYWNSAVGHASMLLTDGTYISWWPDVDSVDAKTLATLPTVFSAPHIVDRSYAADLGAERRSPEVIINLGTLDEAAIRAWWDPYNADPKSIWQFMTANCSTIVFTAMEKGGVVAKLTPSQQDNWNTLMGPWTPDSLAGLVMMFEGS